MAVDLPPCRFLDGSTDTPAASIIKIHRDEVRSLKKNHFFFPSVVLIFGRIDIGNR